MKNDHTLILAKIAFHLSGMEYVDCTRAEKNIYEILKPMEFLEIDENGDISLLPAATKVMRGESPA